MTRWVTARTFRGLLHHLQRHAVPILQGPAIGIRGIAGVHRREAQTLEQPRQRRGSRFPAVVAESPDGPGVESNSDIAQLRRFALHDRSASQVYFDMGTVQRRETLNGLAEPNRCLCFEPCVHRFDLPGNIHPGPAVGRLRPRTKRNLHRAGKTVDRTRAVLHGRVEGNTVLPGRAAQCALREGRRWIRTSWWRDHLP